MIAHAFQPIRELHAGGLVGFEALARFPEGKAPPDVWEAAPTDIWPELDRASVASALRQARARPGLLHVRATGARSPPVRGASPPPRPSLCPQP